MSARRFHDGLRSPGRRGKPTAPAEVIPFPADSRAAFVTRQAATMATYRPEAAERYLGQRLQAHRETLARKGVAGAAIEADCRALQSAIHAALWRIIMSGGAK